MAILWGWLVAIGAGITGVGVSALSWTFQKLGEEFLAHWMRMLVRVFSLALAMGLLAYFVSWALGQLALVGLNAGIEFGFLNSTVTGIRFIYFMFYLLGLDVIIPLAIASIPIRLIMSKITIPLI